MKPHISNYWGKARPSLALSAQWHPLAYHGLDVAASGHALLAARPQLLTALANAAGQPEPITPRWLPNCCGKIRPIVPPRPARCSAPSMA